MRTIVDLPEPERDQLDALCRLRGMSLDSLGGVSPRRKLSRSNPVVQTWLESFPRLPLDDAIARETVLLRQQHGLKVPDSIILATARCAQLSLATHNSRDFPLTLTGVLYHYKL